MEISAFSSPNSVYGVIGKNQGPLIYFSLCQENKENHYAMHNKNIYFLFDNSASMYYTLPAVKTSILTFRDLMCGRTSSFHPPVTKELFNKYMANFKLFTFSEVTKHIWPSLEEDFESVVNSVEPEGSTNMGEAIETVFKHCNPQKANWVVIFTDGESNKGKYQTEQAFKELATKIPENTKIITLGYGTEFNVEILNSIGDFTFLENVESIPTFMGMLTHEISTCSVFQAKVRGGVKLFGKRNQSSFSSDKICNIGFSSGDIFVFDYVLIGDKVEHFVKTYEVRESSEKTQDMPEQVKVSFYNYQASKMIKKLLVLKNEKTFEREVQKCKLFLEEWTDEQAREPREYVLRIAKTMKTDASAVCLANSLAKQTSYVNDKFATPIAVSMAKTAVNINDAY